MAYDIDSLKKGKNAPGKTQETTDKETREAGLYRHPESGAELATRFDPLYGNSQSEAAVRAGFVRVGDVPEDYEKRIKVVTKGETASGASNEDLKGLQARLTAIESEKDAEIAKLKAQLAGKSATPNEVTGDKGKTDTPDTSPDKKSKAAEKAAADKKAQK